MRGIALKTFIFSSLLTTVAIALTLGALCLVLPGYYKQRKTTNFTVQAEQLAYNLEQEDSLENCASIISGFASQNNAQVLAFDENDTLHAELSSPFISLGVTLSATRTDPTVENGQFKSFTIRESQKTTSVHAEPFVAQDATVSSGTRTSNVLYSSPNAIILNFKVNSPYVSRISITGTLQPVDEATVVILSLMPSLLAFDLLIALAAAYFYSKLFTKPILALSSAASRMMELEKDVSSGVKSKDELGQLSRNLDLLYQKLCANISTLEVEKETINRLERSKTDFMRAASHELKTPLAALNGIVEGMIDQIGSYKDKEKYLPECKRQIDRLSRLVQEILKASAMDQEMESDQLDISDVASEALEEHKVLIESKNLKITTSLSSCSVCSNEALITQAILNLVSNAVKHSPKGGAISVSTGDLRFSIKNECASIPEEKFKRLFEPFYTLSGSRTSSGSGLGLYIVKRSLDRLGFSYSFEQTETGVEFVILMSGKNEV
ncbi:MAG: HAMP domain-containing histidine kinase [Clostridiales bacterium]|nr:HAMP domain-containing histidine kinase [Clostridiales bacterium]MDR2750951.1 HAMP domain-containing histidine kinase [Clostridiales bacterium]